MARIHAHIHSLNRPPSLLSTSGEEEAVLVPRHFLVLINPMGGKGNGVSDFIQHVQPMFDMAEINYNVIVTGGAGCLICSIKRLLFCI